MWEQAGKNKWRGPKGFHHLLWTYLASGWALQGASPQALHGQRVGAVPSEKVSNQGWGKLRTHVSFLGKHSKQSVSVPTAFLSKKWSADRLLQPELTTSFSKPWETRVGLTSALRGCYAPNPRSQAFPVAFVHLDIFLSPKPCIARTVNLRLLTKRFYVRHMR